MLRKIPVDRSNTPSTSTILAFPQWHFQIPNADFTNASIRVKQGSKDTDRSIIYRTYGMLFLDNAIVWKYPTARR